MKIAVLKEAGAETRVAAIPETVKKFTGLGAIVAVEKGAGDAASISDDDFQAAGATTGTRSDVRISCAAGLALQVLVRPGWYF